MRRFCLILSLLLLAAASLSACGSNPGVVDTGARVIPHPGVEGLPGVPGQGTSTLRPVGYFSYTLPIIPITFTIGFNGSFSIDLSAGAATALGDFRISGGLAESVTNGSVVPDEAVKMRVADGSFCDAGVGEARVEYLPGRKRKKVAEKTPA